MISVLPFGSIFSILFCVPTSPSPSPASVRPIRVAHVDEHTHPADVDTGPSISSPECHYARKSYRVLFSQSLGVNVFNITNYGRAERPLEIGNPYTKWTWRVPTLPWRICTS
ncbi:hypothetical protein F5Y09DRAFT_151307 [Xylaria sp. FL1042]|nr:hypothetical protein F5Y09DRAFT_151307 [Xylaria sp. FL1042]